MSRQSTAFPRRQMANSSRWSSSLGSPPGGRVVRRITITVPV